MKPKQKILELENRKNIYEFIDKHPGVHQRQIIRKINLSEGTVKYHLDYLIKNGYINKNISSGYARFYPSKKIGTIEKKILDIFRQETPRQILIILLSKFGISQADISRELKKDSKNIGRHLKKLIEADIIEPAEFKDDLMFTGRKFVKFLKRSPVGREKIYILKNPALIVEFIVKYKDTFLDEEITKNAIEFMEYISKNAQLKKYNEEKTNERILTTIFDIFPHPYHV